MLKKILPLFLVVCLLTTGFMAVSATDYNLPEDSVAVSGEEYGTTGVAENMSADGDMVSGQSRQLLNSSVIGSTKQGRETGILNTGDAASGSDGAGLVSFDGTNADGTINNSDLINTTLVENSSKYNGMASGPIPETPAASRYSTMRISLAPDIAGTKYEEAAELLGALGIMVGDAGTGAFRPNDAIIRSEMAKVAVYSVGLEDIAVGANGKTRFPDVPELHWATGAINVADQQGMVRGDDVGTFRPDDPVLLQEAIAIIVRAMGYEPAAADKGGYPAGYMYIASSNQLLRGIDGSTAEPATRGDIAQLIFNSLTVNLMEQVGYGTQVRYEVVDKTLLYDKLNVEKGYGQIVGTGETSLTGGSTTAENRIQIGESIFYLGDTNAKQYLGYNVLYYARLDKTTDEKTLINVREQANKNRSVTVVANDIVSVTKGDDNIVSFEYWANDADRDAKTVQIATDATYIYNGKYKTGVTTEQLKPTSGNVVLLDADTNGIYEIVFVNHFTNIVVDTVSTVTGRVTDKYLNGSLVFDEDNSEIMYTLVKDGKEISVGELEEWNVISYTISEDNLLVKGYVSDASVNGTVTEINEEGYRIGSSTRSYKKAASYPNDIELRDRGTFYLDIEGNIAAVDENATVDTELGASRKYAYLVDAAMSTGFATTAQFKLFTATGETTILTSTNKMRFNDAYGTEPSEVVDTLKGGGSVSPQLIMYETNSAGAITALDTATNGTATGAPNKGEFTLNIDREDMIYKTASGKLGNVGIGENTIIFDIPTDAGTDTSKYSIRTRNTLSNDTAYDALVYDLQENYVANVVIITSSTGTSAPESPILVVDYIAETQNEEYEDTDRLYGWQNGQQINILAADKTVLVKPSATRGTTALTAGDIIQYRLNTAGEIDGITLLFDSAAKNTEFITEVTNDLTCVYGRVTKKFSGSVNVSVNGDVRNYATGDAIVYLYDSARMNNKISVVSSADIEIYEEGNETRLFLRIYDDQVQEMVIVR